jgi:hypothetical protein
VAFENSLEVVNWQLAMPRQMAQWAHLPGRNRQTVQRQYRMPGKKLPIAYCLLPIDYDLRTAKSQYLLKII